MSPAGRSRPSATYLLPELHRFPPVLLLGLHQGHLDPGAEAPRELPAGIGALAGLHEAHSVWAERMEKKGPSSSGVTAGFCPPASSASYAWCPARGGGWSPTSRQQPRHCSPLQPPTCSRQQALRAAEGEHGGQAPRSTGASAVPRSPCWPAGPVASLPPAPSSPRCAQRRARPNETVYTRPPGTLRGHLCRNSWKEEKRR